MIIINKIFDLFGYDGCKHIILSSILFILFSLIFSKSFSIIIVFLLGIFKEYYDKKSKKGCSEIKDVICNIIGILIGIL